MLDEPTTGLDPQARHLVWDRLFHLKKRGAALVLGHALHGRGGAALPTGCVVMDRARIVATGTPQDLIRRLLLARGGRAPAGR